MANDRADTLAEEPQAESNDEHHETESVEPAVPRTFVGKVWDFIRPILILICVLFALRSSIADWNDVPTGSMIPTILEGDRIFVNKLAYDLKIPFTTRHIAEWGDPKRGDIVVFFSPEPNTAPAPWFYTFGFALFSGALLVGISLSLFGAPRSPRNALAVSFCAFALGASVGVYLFNQSWQEGTRLVKRCVGVPGDEIQVHDDQLYINKFRIGYAPLDPRGIAFLTDKDRSDFTYLTETLGTHAHPIRQGKLYRNGNPYVDFGPVTIPQGKYFMMGDNRDNSRDSRWFGFVDRSSIVGRASAVAISIDINRHWIPRWKRFFTSLP
jgi:signal peptidase I